VLPGTFAAPAVATSVWDWSDNKDIRFLRGFYELARRRVKRAGRKRGARMMDVRRSLPVVRAKGPGDGRCLAGQALIDLRDHLNGPEGIQGLAPVRCGAWREIIDLG
jgi:hypothetical protein